MLYAKILVSGSQQMHYRRLTFFGLLIAVGLGTAGCETKPYYTFDGSGEAKKLVVHKKDGKKIIIPLGSGVGGGLWKFIDPKNAHSRRIRKTVKTKEGVKFTVTFDHGQLSIKDVSYDGKKLKSW